MTLLRRLARAVPPLWWACVAGLALAAPSVARAAGVTDPVVLGAAAVVAAVTGVAAAGVPDVYKAVRLRRYTDALEFQSGCLADQHGRVPRVRDVTDPTILGVHPAIFAPVHAGPAGTVPVPGGPSVDRRVPAYVPRDIDVRLRESVAAGGFVLLIGDSTAGKTRAMFEAVASTCPGHFLLVPGGRDALPAAVTEATKQYKWVLWLDDLERFLGIGGLSGTAVARLTALPGDHAIVGTLRAAEHARLTEIVAGVGDDQAAPSARDARDVIDHATTFRLPRLFSASEQMSARDRDWDPRIADAIAHAEGYGIAEYLAAGPGLLNAWLDAWAPGMHPRAAALISAAVDCRRAGLTGSLPRTLLNEIHEEYLAARGGTRLRPEPLADAWNWATAARGNTTAAPIAIDSAKSGPDEWVLVFDYLVDHVQRHPSAENRIPTPTLLASIDYATADEAQAIGQTSLAQGWYDIMGDIFKKAIQRSVVRAGAEHPDTWWLRAKLADVRFDEGFHHEAEAEYRILLEAFAGAVGLDHVDTLKIRSNLGTVLFLDGRPNDAEREYRTVLNKRTKLLGPEDPETLRARELLTWAWNAQGRHAEAAEEMRSVVDSLARVLSPDHPRTLDTRGRFARNLYDLDRYEEAEREYRFILEARTRLIGPDDPATLEVRESMAWTWQKQGRHEEAQAELRSVLSAMRRVLGSDHPRTRASETRIADSAPNDNNDRNAKR